MLTTSCRLLCAEPLDHRNSARRGRSRRTARTVAASRQATAQGRRLAERVPAVVGDQGADGVVVPLGPRKRR